MKAKTVLAAAITQYEHPPIFSYFQLHFASSQKYGFCPPYILVFLPRQEIIAGGLSPYHIWSFNTSLASTNEPRAAAAPLGPADFAQMFISRSPAVPGYIFLLLYSFDFACLSQGALALSSV